MLAAPDLLNDARARLGVDGAATPEDLARAFRLAVKRVHPDAGGDPADFHRMVEAYRLLLAASAPIAEQPVEILSLSPRQALFGDADLGLPPGLRQGDRVRLKGSVLPVRIIAEDGLWVLGDDLWLVTSAAPSELARGGRRRLITPFGPREVWVPPTEGDAARLRLPGLGLPAAGARPQGDLMAVIEADPAQERAPVSRARLHAFRQTWAAA
ncbi:molecular chaperone DnaJ [Brevundimonas sp. 2R-24]|uniref:Molecular chaperone DnaJ n=1 Tax=Peiella sedimenti TaxID=3061083 RepID=A0ABT8SMA0_9CAUL|nr:molecular chaperone DnaJ [Caulobacteraceae bacterium XZ-24]